MADKKISELVSITGSATAADDYFVVVDTSGAVTHKISREELNNAIEQDVLENISITNLTSDLNTNGNDIKFADNDKAIFGAGSDLQIYHDGSNSYIIDTGTGGLFQKANAEWAVQSQGTDEYFIRAASNAWTKLYYNGLEKLATTSTGVDVTGSVTASGDVIRNDTTTGTSKFALQYSGSDAAVFKRNNSTGVATIANGYAGAPVDAINISLAGNVGIGTNANAPHDLLHVKGSSGASTDVSIQGGDDTNDIRLFLGGSSGPFNGQIIYEPDVNALEFATSGSERMRIDSSGNVGIGTSSPAYNLDVYNPASTGAPLLAQFKSAGGDTQLYVDNSTITTQLTADNANSAGIVGTKTNHPFVFRTNNTERMRIDSSGNVGIGTSSPSRKLELNNGGTGALVTFTDGVATNFTFKTDGSNVGTFGTEAGGTQLAFMVANSEKMRIESNGRVHVNQTSDWAGSVFSAFATGGPAISARTNQTNGTCLITRHDGAGIAYNVQFYNGASFVGSIQTTASATSYVTSSDYRLKTAVEYDWDATSRLKQLKPARFEWIADGDDAVPVDGFLAHEVSDIVPEAISGTKDAVDDEGNPVYQGIDQSKLTPLLTKALIEAVGKIEQLEARITALEANNG